MLLPLRSAAHTLRGGFEVAFDVPGAPGEARELEGPEVDPRKEVFVKIARAHIGGEVAVGFR